MTNHYEVADVIELGRAQELVLGRKIFRWMFDSNTLAFGSEIIDWLDETE